MAGRSWYSSELMTAGQRIGENLTRLLDEQGKTQAELADASGLSQGQISQIVNEKRSTPFENLDKFAEFLQVDVSELLKPSKNTTLVTSSDIANRDNTSVAEPSSTGTGALHGSTTVQSPDSVALAELRRFVHHLSQVLAAAAEADLHEHRSLPGSTNKAS